MVSWNHRKERNSQRSKNENAESIHRIALYDLGADMGEKNNVLASHPEVETDLRSYAKAFEEELAQSSRPAAFLKMTYLIIP